MPEPKTDVEAPSGDLSSKRNSSSNNSGALGNGRRASTAALLRNPLEGMTKDEILADVDHFVTEKGLTEDQEWFRKGGLLAQVNNTPYAFEQLTEINEEEKAILRKELTHRWAQPFTLYFLCTLW